MTTIDVVHRYVDAWNAHDADAIAAVFAEDGTYSDPSAGEGLPPAALTAYAGALFAAFPDLHFDHVRMDQAGPDTVYFEWLMRGTFQNPLRGLPPTGCTMAVPGLDLIDVRGDRIASVRGFFDRQALLHQIGVQVVVQPDTVGPTRFGTSVHLDVGSRQQPGAVALTMIELRDASEIETLQAYSRRTMADMATMPGFIGHLAAVNGLRGYTISVWADIDAPRRLMQSPAHREAMQAFHAGGLGWAAQTSVWVPARLNHFFVRCPCCEQLADSYTANGTCRCGATLPERPVFW